VYCGISEVYHPFQAYPSSVNDVDDNDYPVSHVENYTNRVLDESGERLRGHRFPSLVEVSLLTSDGDGVPIHSRNHQHAAAKKNIDLVVLKVRTAGLLEITWSLVLAQWNHISMLTKPGRNINEALALFDIKICKTSFNGTYWSVPDPCSSFMGCTDLIPSIDNEITCQYITSIMKQARRGVLQVAQELGLPLSRQRQYGYGRALQAIGTDNVFDPLALRPTTCTKRIALVHFMRTHLISNAIRQVEQKDSKYRIRLPPLEPLEKHNHIMCHNYQRYVKYIQRGITIEGIKRGETIEGVQELTETNLTTELQKTVLTILPTLEEVHRSIVGVLPGTAIEDYRTELHCLSLISSNHSIPVEI